MQEKEDHVHMGNQEICLSTQRTRKVLGLMKDWKKG